MATELAKAYVQIVPSAKGIGKKISDEVGKESEGAGKTAGSKICNAIKGVIATAAIGKALGSSLTEGAALEQSIGGIETLFKDSADKVKQNAAEAYRTAGMSANKYMELTTSFAASLMQSLGNDTAKAAEISDMAMTDMSDNANKMGTDMERITDAYQGFAKQDYTMLDNLKLGYGGTKTEMERLLADAQKITGIKYDINNLSDVYSAIHVIQGELDITGTTAKEAASTLSGSFASMKAALKNVIGNLALGEDINDELYALQETVHTFLVGNLVPMVGNILMGLPGLIKQALNFIVLNMNIISNNAGEIVKQGIEFVSLLAEGIITSAPYIVEAAIKMISSFGETLITMDWMTIARNMINSIRTGLDVAAGEILGTDGNIVQSVVNAIEQNLPQILQEGSEIITNIVNGILQNLPVLIVGAGQVAANFLSAITSALPTITQKGGELLLNLVDGIINNLPSIIAAGAQAVAKMASSIAQNLPQMLQSGITMLGQVAAGLIRAIPDLVGKIPEIISSVKDAFAQTDWGAVGKNIIEGIGNGLKNAGSALWDAVSGVLGSFKDKVLGFFGIHSPSRWGVYVGEMIDKGLANGIKDNQNSLAKAVRDINETISSPLSANMAYSVNGTSAARSNNEDMLAYKIDELISLLKNRSGNGKEIVLVLKDREVGRALKEMGVAFR